METNIKNDSKNIYTIMCNGSKYSEYCYDFITKECFNSKTDFLYLVHIKNKNQSQLPFIKQANSVQSHYESKLIGAYTSDSYKFSVIEKRSDDELSLALGYEYCQKIKSDLIVVGYQGTSVLPKDKLTNNIKYIVDTIKAPFLIIKDYHSRENKGYTWLICLDEVSKNTKAWEAFQKSMKLIKNDDLVVGFHVKLGKGEEVTIEKEFNKYVKDKNFKTKLINVDGQKGVSVANSILKFINYDELKPDFIVLGHNPVKYFNSEIESPAIEILRKAEANIFFCSG